MSNPSQNERLVELLLSKLGKYVISGALENGDAVVRIHRATMLDFFKLLKIDSELAFDLFLSVTAVDWMDKAEDRYELVYHLLSLKKLCRLRIKISLPEHNPEVDSVSAVWPGANFMEREVWDMYGVTFRGHPDLRRVLMYPEFQGHPLRKDYPIQGKQPRVKLRSPEVTNTARNMKRDSLVQIRKKTDSSGAVQG